MATSPEQRAKVKKNLADLSHLDGNGFIQSVRRTISNNKDFYLIVGLGGVGTNAVYEVKKELKKKLDRDSFSRFTRFLFVDSAKDDLTSLRTKSNGVIDENETIPLPYDGMAHKLETDSAYMRAWVSPQLKHHHEGGLNGSGAGNRRQCGRVLISGSAAQNLLRTKVTAAVNELIAQNDDHNGKSPKCHLIMVAGIAGGTGSGTVIDATYFVNSILSQDLFSNHKGHVFGFVILPPAAAPKLTGEPDQVATGDSNGYAALKEIEYNMTRDRRGSKHDPFIVQYESERISLDKNLFDYCFLIDGHTSHGLHDKPKDAAAKTVADSVLTIVAAQHSMQDAIAGDGGAGAATSSLITAMSDTRTRAEDQVRKNELSADLPRDNNYIYNAVGYSECVIPTDLLTVYAAKKLFDRMYAQYKNSASADRDAAISFCSELGLNVSALKDKIKAEAKIGLLTSAQKSGDLIEDAELNIQSDIEIKFNSKTDSLFKKKGPYYLVNLFNQVSDFLGERGAIDAKGTNKDALLEEAARRIYLYFADISRKLNNSLWEVYTAVLDELEGLFRDTDSVFTKTVITQREGARSYSWTPISSNDSAGLIWLNDIMDDQRISDLTAKFVQGLYDKKNDWIEYGGKREFNAVAFIRDFVEHGFKIITEMNIQDFIAKCYSGDPKAQGLDAQGKPTPALISATKEIAGKLHGNGELLASLKEQTRYNGLPNLNVLLCPEQTDAVNKLIKQELTARGVAVNDYTSKNANTFSLFTSQFGLSAEAFSWVGRGEKAYQGCKDGIGRHLCEGTTDWHSLPNLVNPVHWNDIEHAYQFKDERVLRTHVQQLLDTAREYGLVSQYDPQNDQFHLKTLREDDEFAELKDAVVTFTLQGEAVIQDIGVDAIYKKIAEKLFAKLDTTVVHDLNELVNGFDDILFVDDYTRPHNMPYPEHASEAEIWEYTGKFLRKMYNVCISLQRTNGVVHELREMVIANNKVVDAENRKISFIKYFGYGLVFFSESDNAWQYKDAEGNDRDLLLIDSLDPWQEQFQFYFLQEKFVELSNDIFEAWDENITTLSEDKEVLKQARTKKTELAATLGGNIAYKAHSSDSVKRQLATTLKNVKADKLLDKLIDCYKLAISQLGS